MRSPKNMRTIQIEITNACVHECSNCTRFCGHHKKPFFMTFETFEKAVYSLKDFTGTIGIMGGEPTIHPEFGRFLQFLSENRKSEVNIDYSLNPISNYMEYIASKNRAHAIVNRSDGYGLWSSMPKHYYNHFEKIHEVFGYQCLNDHINDSYHSPLLLARKDYNVPDDEWYKLRDACWVQNIWAASITPKGAFFCEIAAALDALFDGPGGWPIESDWWKREPKDFGEQLKWCELCGAALKVKSRKANDGVDDVSPTLYQKLKERGSRKLLKHKVVVYDGEVNTAEDSVREDKYIGDILSRFAELNKNLYITSFVGIAVCDANSISSVGTILDYLDGFSELVILIQGDIQNIVPNAIKSNENVRLLAYDEKEGINVDDILMGYNKHQWFIMFRPEGGHYGGILERLKKVVVNPGGLYLYQNRNNSAYAYIFNSNAYALSGKNMGYDDFDKQWPSSKVMVLDGFFDKGKKHFALGYLLKHVLNPYKIGMNLKCYLRYIVNEKGRIKEIVVNNRVKR